MSDSVQDILARMQVLTQQLSNNIKEGMDCIDKCKDILKKQICVISHSALREEVQWTH